jgi:hypothetical protein
MDDEAGEEEEDLATYLEFARQFMMMEDHDDESDVAVSIIDLLGAASTAAVHNNESSSDDEEVVRWGGSKPGKAPNKNRDFVGAYQKLIEHYFSGQESVYNETDFERRFRMPRSIFNRIYNTLVLAGEPPFVQQYSSIGSKAPGIAPLCRLVACLRKLCYGDADDREDEYLQISEASFQLFFFFLFDFSAALLLSRLLSHGGNTRN